MELARRHWLMLSMTVAIAAGYLVWGVSGNIGDAFSDGTNYLMLADHFSFHIPKVPAYEDKAAVSRFPPIYSLLLGLTGASRDLVRAHTVTVCCLLFAMVSYYWWMLKKGFTRPQAALMVILVAILPATWQLGLCIQSEYLYLGISLIALGFMHEFEQSQNLMALYFAAAVTGVAILTREIGLALLPALLFCARHAPVRSKAMVAAIALLPTIDWHLMHPVPRSYWEFFVRTYSEKPLERIYSQLKGELPALHHGFGSDFLAVGDVDALPDLLGALCLGSALIGAVQRRPEAIYGLANLAILAVWPFPADAPRLLWVLIPAMLVEPALMMSRVYRADGDGPAARSAIGFVAALSLLMTIPSLSFAAQRWIGAGDSDIPGARHWLSWYQPSMTEARADAAFEAMVVDGLQRSTALIPHDQCVLSTRAELVAYFSQRSSFFYPFPDSGSVKFNDILRKLKCQYAVIWTETDQAYPIPRYPVDRIGRNGEALIQSWLPGAREAGYAPVFELLRIQAPD